MFRWFYHCVYVFCCCNDAINTNIFDKHNHCILKSQCIYVFEDSDLIFIVQSFCVMCNEVRRK